MMLHVQDQYIIYYKSSKASDLLNVNIVITMIYNLVIILIIT